VGRSDGRFDAFVERHYDELFRYALVLTGDRDEAGDVVHDALLKLVKHVGRADIEHEGAYAHKTLFRVFLRGRVRRRRERPAAEVGTRVSAVDVMAAAGGRVDMLALLGELPPRMRAVLAARFYLDMTEAEAAKLLGCQAVYAADSRGYYAVITPGV